MEAYVYLSKPILNQLVKQVLWYNSTLKTIQLCHSERSEEPDFLSHLRFLATFRYDYDIPRQLLYSCAF